MVHRGAQTMTTRLTTSISGLGNTGMGSTFIQRLMKGAKREAAGVHYTKARMGGKTNT